MLFPKPSAHDKLIYEEVASKGMFFHDKRLLQIDHIVWSDEPEYFKIFSQIAESAVTVDFLKVVPWYSFDTRGLRPDNFYRAYDIDGYIVVPFTHNMTFFTYAELKEDKNNEQD